MVHVTVMSDLVREAGGTPLDPNWTITPVGGPDKVPSFASLLGSSDLSIAVFLPRWHAAGNSDRFDGQATSFEELPAVSESSGTEGGI